MTQLADLDFHTPIANPDGTPTLYFMQLLQGRKSILTTTESEVARLDAVTIVAGAGLDGGGTLAADTITLDANASAILDLISSIRGTLLYRGSTSWLGLAPGTSGYFLATAGAGADPAWAAGASGTVTTTGTPATGNLAKFSGATAITNADLSGAVTTSGTLVTTLAANAVTTTKILDSAVTLAKIANASANSIVIGAGAAGSGSPYAELTLGTGLTIESTTLRFCGAVPAVTSGTSYTAVIGDADGYRQFTNAGAVAFTIPPNSSVAFPIKTVLTIEQAGSGQVTLTPGAGVTINSYNSALKTAGQYAVAQLKKVGTNTWTAIGNLTP